MGKVMNKRKKRNSVIYSNICYAYSMPNPTPVNEQRGCAWSLLWSIQPTEPTPREWWLLGTLSRPTSSKSSCLSHNSVPPLGQLHLTAGQRAGYQERAPLPWVKTTPKVTQFIIQLLLCLVLFHSLFKWIARGHHPQRHCSQPISGLFLQDLKWDPCVQFKR